MTDAQEKRLKELDNIIAYQADGGRQLTAEELDEHNRLAWTMIKENEERIIDDVKKGL